MNETILNQVRQAAVTSELLRAVAAVRHDGGHGLALGALPVRALYRDEIAQLERLGNTSVDWSRVRVADGFDWRKVRHCHFQGDVLLGRFSRMATLEGVPLPTGLEHATLVNCVIGNEVLLRDVQLLANYVVAEGAMLIDCGTITCTGATAFGNGQALPLGIESGGREVAIYAEINIEVAEAIALARTQPEALAEYAEAVATYTTEALSSRGIIERGAILRSTPTIRNTYVGPWARIESATLVADSTLLSNADEPTSVESGACVTRSVLQWGSRVATLAIVEQSVLIEHAHAEQHGKVKASLVGPNSGVAAGEATACLLGPFVSFHHQALLIATLWPEGRGNVAYGANIGSNHTSKAPDQEFRPGEGAFLGLGVNVKFPTDFSRAPYTILACGVTTLPQKVLFPFSLINRPSASYPGISQAYNEIIPAWLLTDSMYTLRRNERKYQARNKARRQPFDFRIFRPRIVDLMRDACRRLEAVEKVQEVYTERDIDGLGKNLMREPSRQSAIEGYRFFIRSYALGALKERVEAVLRAGDGASIDALLRTPSSQAAWEHARRILVEDFEITDVAAGLGLLPAMLDQVAQAVEGSKRRDDERGQRIIDDYAAVHADTSADPVVRQTWEETRLLQQEIAELVACLPLARTTLGAIA